jgi:hypothetical protein
MISKGCRVFFAEGRFAKLLTCMLVALLLTTAAIGQAKPVYQTGTVMEVKTHEPATDKACPTKCYDIVLRVDETVYVVLYTPPKGSNTVEYRAGIDLPVLVEGSTIKFNDLRGNSVTVPILKSTKVQQTKASSTR